MDLKINMESPSFDAKDEHLTATPVHGNIANIRFKKWKESLQRLLERLRNIIVGQLEKCRRLGVGCCHLLVYLRNLFLRLFRRPMMLTWRDISIRLFFCAWYAGFTYLAIYLAHKRDKHDDSSLIVILALVSPYLFYVGFILCNSPTTVLDVLQDFVVVSPSQLYANIEKARSGQPWLGWEMDCHHTVNDGTEYGLICTTWSGKEEFKCVDVKEISASRLPSIDELNTLKVTLIQMSKTFIFADSITGKEFQRKKQNFQEANRCRDENYNLKTIFNLPGFQETMIVSTDTTLTRPFFFRSWLYVLAVFLFLDMPYLYICSLYWSKIVRYSFIIQFGKPLDMPAQ